LIEIAEFRIATAACAAVALFAAGIKLDPKRLRSSRAGFFPGQIRCAPFLAVLLLAAEQRDLRNAHLIGFRTSICP